MYIEQIKNVAKSLRRKKTPDFIRELKQRRVKRCSMVFKHLVSRVSIWGGRRGGNLFKLLSEEEFLLIVYSGECPKERLITFFHELFHIPFLDDGIPGMSPPLGGEDHQYLEKTINRFAKTFVERYPNFSVKFFEECFGFRHTDFWLE